MSNQFTDNMGFIFGKDFGKNRIPDFNPDKEDDNDDAGTENEGASDDEIIDDNVSVTISMPQAILQDILEISKRTKQPLSNVFLGYVCRGKILERAIETNDYSEVQLLWGITKYEKED